MRRRARGMASSVDGDGAAFDAVHALGVGDEVSAFDEDLAVCTHRDRAVTDTERERRVPRARASLAAH